jgi:hypothetical protein
MPDFEASRFVPEVELGCIYDEVQTPYKYGSLLRPETDEYFDCPNVFRFQDNVVHALYRHQEQGWLRDLILPAVMVRFGCFQPCRRPGPKEKFAACGHAAGLKSPSSGNRAASLAPRFGAGAELQRGFAIKITAAICRFNLAKVPV